jgi:hypothetical protein
VVHISGKQTMSLPCLAASAIAAAPFSRLRFHSDLATASCATETVILTRALLR